jgi:hypothetical protein
MSYIEIGHGRKGPKSGSNPVRSHYLTRKVANLACTLSSAFTSEATAAACSFGAVFAAAAALEKTSLSSGERRRNSFAGSWEWHETPSTYRLRPIPAERTHEATAWHQGHKDDSSSFRIVTK